MSSFPALAKSARPAGAKWARISAPLFTYILPSLAVTYVILSALWLVPDSFAGMYGNYDGR